MTTLAHTEETSYAELLFNAKQKERAEKAKKKKRLLIPVINTNAKKEKGKSDTGNDTDDNRPIKKQKLERSKKTEASDEDEVVVEEGLGGLVNY